MSWYVNIACTQKFEILVTVIPLCGIYRSVTDLCAPDYTSQVKNGKIGVRFIKK